MKINKTSGEFAEAHYGKLKRTVNIRMIPEVKVGDYVIVHAGFALQIIDPEKAKQTLSLIDEIYR